MQVKAARFDASPRPRILVVDGDPAARASYRLSFSSAGWEVIEAIDGRDGLVKALITCPSFVVTELALPLIDGVSLCEILRRDRTTTRIPILVVTSDTRPQLLDRVRDAADEVLQKSSLRDDIVEHVRALMSGPRTKTAPGSPARLPSHARMLTKSFERFATKTPTPPAPALSCPQCGRMLAYEETQIGGVNSRVPERWDYFSCIECGRFQYRHRTRKIRSV